jgi:predicted MFS family arabinose efflux permease
MARAIIAVIAGVIAAFIAILLVEELGALIVPAGQSPPLTDAAAMAAYLATLPMSAYAFVLAAYAVGSAVGGTVAARMVGRRDSRTVWVVGALVLAATVANLVMIPHPFWFSIASVAAILIGIAIAARVIPIGMPSTPR